MYVFYIHNTKQHNNPKIPSSAKTIEHCKRLHQPLYECISFYMLPTL